MNVAPNELRIAMMRMLGAEIGPHAYLNSGTEVLAPENLRIAGGLHIGRFCQVDARGEIKIGHDVVIAGHVLLITADHDIADPGFGGRLGRIVIGDRVWIGSRAVVLKGVVIGEGAVVSAGSVVSRNVPPWTVVRGVPAQPIGERPKNQTYRIDYGSRWH
ncbi:acyltransferase [Rathayibacter sp. CAU 1779]